MKNVYLSSAGLTRFGKREESLDELVLDAVSNMGYEVNVTNIDAVFFGNMSGEEFTEVSNLSTLVTDCLGLSGIPAVRIETGSSSGAAVFQAGFRAIASGCHKTVLVLAAEKMTHLPITKTTKILSEVIDPQERSYGCTMTALAAMVTRRYMHDYGLTTENLAMVAIKNHKNGSKNPYAHFQKVVTMDTVLKSKIVASPIRLYDCSPISDGAAAVLLTSKPDKVKVSGIGQGTEHVAVQFRKSLTSFEATKRAAAAAYKMSGRKPKDIDIAEVHDAFTTFEIINTEDLGFFKPGLGASALLEGKTQLNGELPINPSGGLKARGHPVGVSGLAQVVEIYWQLCGESAGRQIQDPKIGLTQSIGGFASNNLVNILEVV